MRLDSLGVGGVTTFVRSNGDQATWERFYIKLKKGLNNIIYFYICFVGASQLVHGNMIITAFI